MADIQGKMISNLQLVRENILPLILGVTVLYTLYGILHRLYLSPLSPFPGPKLAVLTTWYEFYHDIYPHYGQYAFKIRSLHQIYGPIIRISPHELHISTPQFYDSLYSAKGKRDKWGWMTRTFGMPRSTFATVEDRVHRRRRKALNPFFSGTSVRRLEGVVRERVGACVERIRGVKGTGKVERVVLITSAFSSETEDFGEEIYEATHQGGLQSPVLKHFIWILWTIQSLPGFIVERLGPALAAFVEVKAEFERQVKDIVDEHNLAHKDLEHPTVFHELLNSKLPDEDKTIDRLADEALSVVSAGGETVSWALTVATYHLLANPRIMQNLKHELEVAIPDLSVEPQATALEQLPYLGGVVKECLRLSYGISSRLQRIPHEPLTFLTPDKDWVIPAGTPVSMTSLLIHQDESIFPDHREFRPERWIEDPRLDRYLVAYSKGSRICLGQSLANAEMCMWLSAVFRRFGSKEVRFEGDEGIIELVDTDISDVEVAADRFIPAVRVGSKGVRIRVLY